MCFEMCRKFDKREVMEDLEELYHDAITVDIFEAPIKSKLKAEHTMGDKFKIYIETKLSDEQKNILKNCAEEEISIEVHGSPHAHIRTLLKKYNYEAEKEFFERNRKSLKNFNKDRPKFFYVKSAEGEKKLIITVFPSEEYIYQYAEIIKAWYLYNKKSRQPKISCIIYPILNKTLTNWTGLDTEIEDIIKIVKGDILVIGYVDIFSRSLRYKGFLRLFKEEYKYFGLDRCYGINIYKDPVSKKRCIVLGVNYSFWGSASSFIVRSLLEKGVEKVIYLAKAGTLTGKNPRKGKFTEYLNFIQGPYYIWKYLEYSNHKEGQIECIENITNSFSSYFTNRQDIMITSSHISVPSVVGETRQQEDDYRGYNPSTIDNEISFIAREIKNYSNDKNKQIDFISFHYITDYVTSFVSKHLNNLVGLDKDKMDKKTVELTTQYESIVNYVSREGVDDCSSSYTKDDINYTREDKEEIKWMLPDDIYNKRFVNANDKEIDKILKIFPEKVYDKICEPSEILRKIKDEILNEKSVKKIYLLGEVGSGKSIFTSALYYKYKKTYLSGLGDITPIFINLSLIEKLIIAKELDYKKINDVLSKKIKELEKNIIFFIDGFDIYSEIITMVYNECISPLGIKELVSERIYPFDKGLKKHKGNALTIQTCEFSFLDIDKIVLMLEVAEHIDRNKINKIFELYKKLFGGTKVSYRLIGLLARENIEDGHIDTASHFLNGFIDQYMRRYHESSDSDYTKEKLAEDAYDFVMNSVDRRILKKELGFKKRLLSQSEEMMYYLTAQHICIMLLKLNTMDKSNFNIEIQKLDHVYHHKINKYAKEIINENVQIQNRFFVAIEKLYPIVSLRLKSFLLYLLGRLDDSSLQIKAKNFLLKEKDKIDLSEFSGEQLVLNRTVYISLIYLGEDSKEYIKLMKEYPHWDAVNRGFHLSYYGDKDYYVSQDMLMKDNGESFKNTYLSIERKLLDNDSTCTMDLFCYTLYSLILNRYQNGILEETIKKGQVVQLGNKVIDRDVIHVNTKKLILYIHELLDTGTKPYDKMLHNIFQMKIEKRTGWNYSNEHKERSVSSPESVADHSYSATMIALVFLPETDEMRKIKEYKDYDKDTIIRMLLIHDFPESVTGDIVREERLREHYEIEKHIIQNMSISGQISTDNQHIGNLYINIEKFWKKFEDRNDINAMVAKDIDNIELYFQLIRYLKVPDTVISDKDEFRKDLEQNIVTSLGRRLLKILNV